MGICARILASALVFVGLASAAYAAPPSFEAEFTPTSIGQGGVSTLTFTIDNSGQPAVTGLAFAATLPTAPANMVVSGNGASHTCDAGTLTAANGSRTITFVGGEQARDTSCTATILVTAPTAGTYTLSGVDLANSGGAAVTAADQSLTVVPPSAAALSFVKMLNGTDIELGEIVTATYTMANTSMTDRTGTLRFTENLPSSVVVASPSNTSTTCQPTAFGSPFISALEGGQTILLSLNGSSFNDSFAALSAGESCTVSVDLEATTVGSFPLTSDPLNPLAENVPGNTVVLNVRQPDASAPQISKTFSQDSVAVGSTVDLEFSIVNGSFGDMTNIAFSDDLDAMLAGAVATGLPANDVCGSGSTLSGTSTLSLSGGSLSTRASCTFSVTVQIPGGASAGEVTNLTSAVTANVDGGPTVGADTARDTLFITSGSPLAFSKLFNPAAVPSGTTTSVDYTITNSNAVAASGIGFTDPLNTLFGDAALQGTFLNDPCGSGSRANFDSFRGGIIFSGGNLGAGASCTFSVPVNLAADQPAGTFTSTSEQLSATVNGEVLNSSGAQASLTVNAGVDITLSASVQDTFDGTNDGEVLNGDQFGITFTLNNPTESTASATGITYTFDANAMSPGTTASIASNTCGAATAAISGGGQLLTVSNVTLAPDNSCDVSLTLTAAGGSNADATGTTSPVAFQVGADSGQAAAASATIFIGNVQPLQMSMAYAPSTVLAGDTPQVTYSLTNPNAGPDATSVLFTHSLSAVLSGMTTTGVISDTCGFTPPAAGSSFLIFSGGTVAAGTSCDVTLGLAVPAGAANGDYASPTSTTAASISGATLSGDPANATLSINNESLSFAKEFLTNPAGPGDTVDLQYTLTNPLATALTNVTFTDDLDAALTGATVGAPTANSCGGSAPSGSAVSFTGGTLGANASCTITVPVTIPVGAVTGSYTSTSSAVTADAGASTVASEQATDVLAVSSFADTLFTAVFADSNVDAGQTTSITYTITNNNATALNNLSFSHDVAGTLDGTTATGLPLSGSCGAGSTVSGSGVVALSGGNLAAGAQCSFTVTLSVPTTAAGALYDSSTAVLSDNGLQVGDAASDTITVTALVDLSATISDGVSSVNAGDTVVYTIVASNPGPSPDPAAAFSTVAPANAACTYTSVAAGGASGNTAAGAGNIGDTLNLPGAASVTYTASCAVPADGTGSLVHSASIAKSAGVAETATGNNTASDTNSVTQSADLNAALVDNADPIFAGGTVIYTATVNNAGPSDAATVSTTFTLPAGLTLVSTSGCAEDPGGVATCTLGTIAASGSASYTVTATADAATSGLVSAAVSAVSSVTDPATGDNSASETTTVQPQADISINKTDGVTTVVAGQTVTYAVVVSNAGPSTDPAVSLADTFPAGLSCDYTSTPTGGATGNSAASGAASISDILSMPSGSAVSYQASCLVAPTATGTLSNTATAAASINDPDTSNNSATDADTAVTPLIFDFSKSFAPATVSVGQVSTLTFLIDNNANTLASTGMAFTDPLPGGMIVAPTPNATNTCGGTFSAASGTGTVSLSGGTVTGGATCSLSVDVVSSVASTLNNVTTALSSNFPDAAAATASLAVNPAGAPVFTKSFAPDTVAQGGVSRLTLTLDNGANFVDVTGGGFTDTFPAGMVLASPANASETCGGTLRLASVSGGALQYSGATIAANDSCTISVDVLATGAGALVNTSGDFTSNLPTSSGPSATLTSTPAIMTFAKSFAPATIQQTQSTTVTYAIGNNGNLIDATNMAFSETLTGGLVVAPVPATSNTCGGTVAATAGGTAISLSGGTLSAGGSCEISVLLVAPTPGVINGTTSVLTSSLTDVPAAAATLTVDALIAPGFTAAFNPASIAQGDTSVLTYEIANTNALPASGLAFSVRLPSVAQVAALPAITNTCGGTFAPIAGDTGATFSGGVLSAGATCAISVTVQGLTAGAGAATTGTLSSTELPASVATSANLVVAASPLNVSMGFTPATIEETQSSVLTYSISNNASIAANGVTLSDTLPANLVIAASPAATTTCAGTFGAAAGGSSVSLSAGSLAAGGSCTVSIPVTSNVIGSYTNALETANSSLGTSTVADATLDVVATTRGTVTIRQISDADATFNFTSSEPSLTFAINTVGGSGQQGPITLVQGTYIVQQTAPAGVGNASIQCSDADSSGDAASGILTLNISPSEAVTCTISAVSSQQKTVDTINSFLTKRADLILSTAPDSSRRIDRLNRGFGNASALQFSNGDLKSLLPFSTQISGGGKNFSFSTSLLQARQAAASLALAHGSPKDTMFVDNNRWDAWFEAQYKTFDQGVNGEGHFAVAYFGADYLVTPDLLIGAMLQFDDMEDVSTANNTTASGSGWMFGPYVTARIGERLYFDGRISAGRSTNNVSPFNTYTDQFETTRWMAQAALTGEFVRGDWTISPNASLSYYEEEQESYTDALNVLIPGQTVRLGQIQVGPTFTGNFESPDGSVVSPFFGFDALYNIGDTSGVTLSNSSSSASVDGWRARLRAGIKFSDKHGTKFGLSGSYDGIGQSDYETWGFKLDISIPLD